jgi:hypothetical protein
MAKFLTALTLLYFAFHLHAEELSEPTVGMSGRIEQLVLPGPELQPIPLTDDKTPIVLRITEVFPHGTDFRYDMEFYGLDAGKYDLAKFLQRKDGSAAEGLPEIAIEIKQQLPEGQILPKSLETSPLPFVGGYTHFLIAAAVIWVVGLLMLLFIGRKKKTDKDADFHYEPTFAERLRPMVALAASGEELSQPEQAKLERLLLSFWRKRLKLEGNDPAEAMKEIRNHKEAGELLQSLENWLHRPPGSVENEVDVEKLLEPYRNIKDDSTATA